MTMTYETAPPPRRSHGAVEMPRSLRDDVSVRHALRVGGGSQSVTETRRLVPLAPASMGPVSHCWMAGLIRKNEADEC